MNERLNTGLLWFAVFFVLAAYAFFGSMGHFQFRSRAWDLPGGRPGESMYASLAEGFLRGRLSMAHAPDPRLAAMPYPFEAGSREKAGIPYLWDASYFNGRYYLYFTPLPALMFYIPFRLGYGAYPDDQLAGAVFAAWGFLMMVAFVRRAMRLAGLRPGVPSWLTVLLLGLGNVIPFMMPFMRTYEVATLCGMAMSATWAWSLLRYVESPTARRLLIAAIWLGLSIAARPNLGVLLLPSLAVVLVHRPAREVVRSILLAAIPLAVVGGALLAYNYARFHEPFEFGIRYQLTAMDMRDHRVCGCGTRGEFLRLLSSGTRYLFAPPSFGGEFPFVDLPGYAVDEAVSFGDRSDGVGGLAPMIPLALAGSLFAALLALSGRAKDTGTRAALLVTCGGWVSLIGISACWFISARYEVDFMMLIAGGALVCFEAGLAFLASAGVRVLPLRIAGIVAACWSIVLGSLLGLQGTSGQFAMRNPELFRRLSELF